MNSLLLDPTKKLILHLKNKKKYNKLLLKFQKLLIIITFIFHSLLITNTLLLITSLLKFKLFCLKKKEQLKLLTLNKNLSQKHTLKFIIKIKLKKMCFSEMVK
jgi:hypothetical protein